VRIFKVYRISFTSPKSHLYKFAICGIFYLKNRDKIDDKARSNGIPDWRCKFNFSFVKRCDENSIAERKLREALEEAGETSARIILKVLKCGMGL